MKKSRKPINVRELRMSLGMNQGEFWGPIGVTQSGGSRYENDRCMPKPVAKLVDAVYVKMAIDIDMLGALGNAF